MPIRSDVPLLHMPDAINQIISWADQAGQIAMRYFQNVDPHYKSDQTLLTEADLEIEQFLTKQIQKTYSGHILIGEEGTRRENNRQSSYIWAIDPIDGTTAFVQGLPGWGIAIGLLYQGQPCFGLFYRPLLDDLTYTTGQGGVVCNGHKITATVCSDWGPKGFLAVDAGAHHNFYLNVKRIRALGSTGANLVYVARGTATATFNSKVRLWDVVAGAAILNQVGGTVQYLSGKPLDYLSLLDGQLAPEPIIAGHSEVLVGLKEVIRSR